MRKVQFAASWHGVFAGLALLGGAYSAEAAVKLSFSPTGGTPAAAAVAPGGTLNLSLYLISTAEITTGINDLHFSIASGPGTGAKFTLSTRDLTGSSYPQAFPASFSAQTLPTPTNLSQATPDNANAIPIELPAGNYLVATYAFVVDATAPKGAYTLQTFDATGEGFAGGAATGYVGGPFTTPATITVVVPEPSTLALAGIASAALAGRRRRR